MRGRLNNPSPGRPPEGPARSRPGAHPRIDRWVIRPTLNTGWREPTAGWAQKTPDWDRTGDLVTRIYNTGAQTAKLRAQL